MIASKANKLLSEARKVASEVKSWADFSAKLFDQKSGLVALYFPDDFERQAFYDSEVYKEINGLLVKLMKGFGVVKGAEPSEKSGKFLVRVPKTVHHKLEMEAKREGVSLNQLAVAKLTLPLRDDAGLSEDLIVDAFNAVHDGWSTDWVIINDELDQRFLDRCLGLGLGRNHQLLNHKLMNIRKNPKNKGRLQRATQRSGFPDYDDYAFAAEIAVRSLQRTEGVTLDMILCSPDLRVRFDAIARELCHGVEAIKLRAAALNLRKSHRLRPIDRNTTQYDLVASGPVRRVDLTTLSEMPGLYALYDVTRPVFAGETDNLRKRIASHMKGGLPLWAGNDDLSLKSLVIPKANKDTRLGWLTDFINRERPLLNYQKAA